MTTTPTPTPESVIARLRRLAEDWNVQRLVSWDQQANDGDIREFHRQVNQAEHLCLEAANACETLIRERQQERSAEVGRLADYAAAAALVVELRAERDSLKAKLDVAVATLNDVAQCSCSGSYPCDCYPAGERQNCDLSREKYRPISREGTRSGLSTRKRCGEGVLPEV